MLGPLLFLAYINNLPSKVNAKARLLADDYLLYRHINGRGCSLYKITSTSYRTAWEANWQMHLNHDKCELIRITNKHNTINATYLTHNFQLKQTKRAKYLGLLLPSVTRCPGTPTLTPSPSRPTTPLPFCEETCQHAQRCYITFLRPQVEYADTVWDPHTTDNIKKVEAVQWRVARFVTGDY